ncbi:unnamed protein product [Sphenostylis stenocarpa]|uniref:Uncharacterized protein n=1 Tax=Sphenostylis stenocarpa TaxID=92480 RepID=A0AA86SYF9_9FABA|nr:unnamed protein product [Sphenostylis stenocarpa]
MEERGTCGLGTRRLIGGFAEGMVKMRWLTKIGSGEAVRKQLELGSESWWFVMRETRMGHHGGGVTMAKSTFEGDVYN